MQIVYTHFQGEITKSKTLQWLTWLRDHLNESTRDCLPVVAIVDLTRAAIIDSTARLIFADATTIDRVRGIIYITTSARMALTVQIIGLLGVPRRVHHVMSLDAAEHLASELLTTPAVQR